MNRKSGSAKKLPIRGRRTLTSSMGPGIETFRPYPETSSGGATPIGLKFDKDADSVGWLLENPGLVRTALIESGAVLLRGLNIDAVDQFQRLVSVLAGSPLEYVEQSSPRTKVHGAVYTSTDHPQDQTIFLHNEQSYNMTWPARIAFYCQLPAEQGGATPIADCRNVLRRIDAPVLDRFKELGYMLVRNYGDGLGVSWQMAFQTESKARVEAYCRENSISWEWKDGDRLRTRQVRPAVIHHPKTNEPVWFNHATFFHVLTLEASVREVLLAEYGPEDLPHNTFYGDGSTIAPDDIDSLRSAYEDEKLEFTWQRGDVLLLDNVLFAHGRSAYSGKRKVVVAMSDPFRHNLRDLAHRRPQ